IIAVNKIMQNGANKFVTNSGKKNDELLIKAVINESGRIIITSNKNVFSGIFFDLFTVEIVDRKTIIASTENISFCRLSISCKVIK
ncbi:MAG: hypothetical protein KJO48_09590, partial [Ignavibacteria bacterium]|nr:hypothetical protein [Ignavibacteria bacterium]